MKKLSSVLLLLVVAAFIAIFVGIYVSDNYASNLSPQYQEEKRNKDAISIATHDELFMQMSKNGMDQYWIGNISRSGFGEYGYVNVTGDFVDVPIQLREYAPMRVDFVYTIDLNTRNVMIKKLKYSEGLMGGGIYTKIPLGSSF